ncbi:MAG TPA: hypothetical protein PLU85_10770 [Bacteroidia bacterium]|jgi:phage gp36-like protein|nr:hypothetical protein [Bacteroidia bacterium]QQR96375.1 MAG: hypothetical protein IPJ93_07120 [Bacteroidota bacterium]MBP7713568.1 hypothetical protein [Bacteroidia bacterium]MBP8667410.1 hypothetical protein [Bacteroidia bacterium]HOZ89680.1 hypothetical protein [Bacteroidia bacterium]
MHKRYIYLTSVIAGLLLTGSCSNKSGEENKEQTTETKDTMPVSEVATFQFTYTIANLPPPMQVLDEFSKSKLEVNTALLNSADNADKYMTSLKQAMNYGIYGVDLGYLVVNNRTLDAIKYYNTAKNLAAQLGMEETFNQFVNRFETNSNNRDSLTRVIDDAYSATDAYLRSNKRLETASQVLAGSWLECQYLTVKSLLTATRNADNEILYKRVWEQRLYLDNITKLLSEFADSDDSKKIKSDYEALLAIYKEPADEKQIDNAFLTRLASGLEKARQNIVE